MQNKLKIFFKEIAKYFLFYMDIYALSYFFIKSKKYEKEIIFLRVDNIGDFILWLWEAQKIKENYKECKITLICNKIYFELAKEIKYFDKVIPIDAKKYHLNFKYKYKFLKKMNENLYLKIINPMNSRCLLSESLIKNINALEKIGNYGDTTSLTTKMLEKSSKNYTKIFKENLNIKEELLKNLAFNNWLFNKKDNLRKPSFKIKKEFLKQEILDISSQEYYIFSLGASLAGKCWEIEKFVKLYLEVFKNKKRKLILVGSKNEIILGNQFLNLIKDKQNIMNLIGKTNLFELSYLVKNTQFLVCNDSLVLHIAALTNTKGICILGCWQFEKVLPYPKIDGINFCKIKEITNKIECFNCNFKCNYKDIPFKCIKLINENDVIEITKTIIEKGNNKNGCISNNNKL